MLKHQTTLVTGLATLLVAPPILFGDELQQQLEEALKGTVQAIEVVSGLKNKLEVDPDGTIPLVLSVTEQAEETAQQQDERLAALRQEVSLLRMQLDAVENPEVPAAGAAGEGVPNGGAAPPEIASTATAPSPGAPTPAPAIPSGTTSTGLSPSLRAMLKRSARSRAVNPSLQQKPEPNEEHSKPQIAANSYSADPLGQAKASYRAGRFADGLVLLDGRKDAESMYWRARCLARLDRYDEAIETMTKVIELEGDSYTGKRAATDLEFFQWKRDFDKKLPARSDEGEGPR